MRLAIPILSLSKNLRPHHLHRTAFRVPAHQATEPSPRVWKSTSNTLHRPHPRDLVVLHLAESKLQVRSPVVTRLFVHRTKNKSKCQVTNLHNISRGPHCNLILHQVKTAQALSLTAAREVKDHTLKNQPTTKNGESLAKFCEITPFSLLLPQNSFWTTAVHCAGLSLPRKHPPKLPPKYKGNGTRRHACLLPPLPIYVKTASLYNKSHIILLRIKCPRQSTSPTHQPLPLR